MAADPTKCAIKVMSPGVVSEWTGTFAEFKGLLKFSKPPMGCSSDNWKETLQKWLVIQCFCAAFVFPAQLLCYVLAAVVAGLPVVDVITNNLVSILVGIVVAFIASWCGWFMLIKRDPSCICCLIVYVESWSYLHMLFGLFMVIYGVGQILNAVDLLLTALDLLDYLGILYVVFFAVATALVGIYGIANLYVGIAATRYGAEIAGVKLPEVPAAAAGKAEEP